MLVLRTRRVCICSYMKFKPVNILATAVIIMIVKLLLFQLFG